MRNICALVLAAGLILPTAGQAADGTLPAGKPAGVKQAELISTPLLLVLGAAAIATVVAVASAKSGTPLSTAVSVSTTSP